jgi:di/tricarboxylate transporter
MSGLSSVSFLMVMLPLGAILLLVLLLFTYISFPDRPMERREHGARDVRTGLLRISALLLPVFVLSLEFGFAAYVLPLVLLAFIPFRDVLKRADWPLIALFFLMFMDFGLLASLPGIGDAMAPLAAHPMPSSALLSQFISNVPAAIFMSSFTTDWKAVAYGVNVGGNGLLIASMASVIAVRLSKMPLAGRFHRYSIPFFAITFTLLLLAKLF